MKYFLGHGVVFILLLLSLLFMFFSVGSAQTLDIRDGYLFIQSYRIELPKEKVPIILYIDDDETVLEVRSEMRTILHLGLETVELTDAAAAVVRDRRGEEDYVPGMPEVSATKKPDICPHCQVQGLQAHLCPRCQVYFCIHNDFECGYRLNPVPTLAPTAPIEEWEGVVVYESNAREYITNIGRFLKKVSPNEWRPSSNYQKTHTTPKPDADKVTPQPTSSVPPDDQPGGQGLYIP